MKYTNYFEEIRKRPDRKRIKEQWIMMAIKEPIAEIVQRDGRIRRWVWVEEEQRHLRVILLEDGRTVHNAFFDSNFQGFIDNQPRG